MKLETAKSLLLIVLIGISLLLTYGLWSYQPSVETLESGTVDNEADLGGTEESKKSIIQPASIIFHSDDSHFGFSDPKRGLSLYEDMQSWMMNNFEINQTDGRETHNYEVEIIFPDELPMDLLTDLFKFNEEVEMPSWFFKRMYFTFIPETSSLIVEFLSIDGSQQASAVINDKNNYEKLWSYTYGQDPDVFREYIIFNEENTPIYIPAEQIKLERYSALIDPIDPNLLVNALFRNPSVVRSIYNSGERLYTDNQRQIRVFENGSSMEFYNPYPEDNYQTETVNLLESSILNINDHYGWTEEYHLLDVEADTVRYQMYFEGLPVFDNSSQALDIIEQKWINQDLSLYERPLFTLVDLFPGDLVELPSGGDIVYFLENNPSSDYNLEIIQDLQIGYRLEFQGNDSITLVPAWYMNYNGSWHEFKFEELTHIEGGS